MREVLEKSLNTGMAFVSRKIGRELFYRYLKKYGFSERTEIEFEDEQTGRIKDPSSWAESELVTYAFGQGIAVTPIQFIASVGAIANKGILMQPHIVLQSENSNGEVNEYEPKEIRRVISEKTAATMAAMMVSVVENGGASRAKIPGTTIASFVGFAPLKDPKFVMLVKIDRPRTTIWADGTSAPLFADIAQFLFKYYNIPPDA